MRTFIAIEIPHNLQDKMDSLIAELKQSGADVRWVKVKSIHLTLKFLGDIREETVKHIIDKLKKDIPSFEPFQIQLGGLGAFPSLNRPRVVWLGAEGAGQGLKGLQKEIERSLQPLGFEPEKRDFKPHLTLGRVKSSRGQPALVTMIKKMATVNLGEFKADCHFLFHSILKPSGAEYHKLQKFMLKK